MEYMETQSVNHFQMEGLKWGWGGGLGLGGVYEGHELAGWYGLECLEI